MKKQFEAVSIIEDEVLFKKMAEYEVILIKEATANGALSKQDADNEYTREIGRIGSMLADYESTYMVFKDLKFKPPFLILKYA
jgi:hypothetical protein